MHENLLRHVHVERVHGTAVTIDVRGEAPPPRVIADTIRWLHSIDSGFVDARLAPALSRARAVQRAAESLTAAGVGDFCLALGDDAVARGCANPGRPWRLGIRDPLGGSASIAVLDLHDGAVATARTRGTSRTGIASVTIAGPDLGVATAHAAAALAMGREGVAWARSLVGYESLAVLDDGWVVTTAAFPTTRG